MADLDDTVARYQAVLEELRAVEKSSHELLHDLRQEQKNLRRMREEFISAEDLVRELDRRVAEGIKKYEDGMLDAIRQAQDRVYRQFDQLMLLVLGEDPESVRQGKATITQLIKELVLARNLPVKLTEEVHIEMSPATKAKHKADGVDNVLMRFRGRGMDDLPILTDSRIPEDHIWLVIPPVDEADRRMVYDLDVSTTVGAEQALMAVADYVQRKFEHDKAQLAKVPAAFRRKGKAGPA